MAEAQLVPGDTAHAKSPAVDLADRVNEALDRDVRPRVESHGGGVALETVSPEGEVILRFFGACTHCQLLPVTVGGRVMHTLKAIEGVTAIKVRDMRVSEKALERIEKFFTQPQSRLASVGSPSLSGVD